MDALWCPRCKKVKPVDGFYKSSRNRSGRQTYCKTCLRAERRRCYHADPAKPAAYNRDYREKNRPQVLEAGRQYRKNNPILERLRRGKNRAIRLGLPAERITQDELLAEWKRRGIDPSRCVYTGEPLRDRWHMDHLIPLSAPDSPGHVVTNLVPSNPGANRWKGRRHLVDFLADRAEAELAS